MKKRVISLLIMICMLVPVAFMFTGCGHNHTALPGWYCDDTYHWRICEDSTCKDQLNKAKHSFKKETISATVDATGSETLICTCGYIKSIKTLPKIIPTTSDILAVLNNVAKKDLYTYIKTDSNSGLTNFLLGSFATPVYEDHMARIGNEMVYYSVDKTNAKPATYVGSEYITNAEYILNNSGKSYKYSFFENLDQTGLELTQAQTVGQKYITNYYTDYMSSAFGPAYSCTDEDSFIDWQKNIWSQSMEFYNMLGINGTISPADVLVSLDGEYKNQEYTLVINTTVENIVYDNDNLMSDYKITYINDTTTYTFSQNAISNITSTTEYTVVDTKGTQEAEDDTSKIETDSTVVTLSTTDGISQINKIKTLTSGYAGTYQNATEEVNIYLNGELYATEHVEFGKSINSYVNKHINFFEQQVGASTNMALYLNKENTVIYNKNRNVIVEDYYGSNVYVVITPVNPTQALVRIEYATNNGFGDIVTDGEKLIVVDSGTYTIDTTFNGQTYNEEIYVDYLPTMGNTTQIEAKNTYYIYCERLVTE